MTQRAKRGRPVDEARAARRRDEILDAATALFAERGYRQTDVQLIADRMGAGKGTVYRYFPTKKTLFLAAVDRGMARMTAEIDASFAATEDPFAGMSVAIRTYLRFFEENAELVELFIQERAEFKDRAQPTYFVHRDSNRPKWRRLAAQLVAAGRLRDAPLDRVMDVMDALLFGTMFVNHFARRKASHARQAEDILNVVLEGILSPRERARRTARERRNAKRRSPSAAGSGEQSR